MQSPFFLSELGFEA